MVVNVKPLKLVILAIFVATTSAAGPVQSDSIKVVELTYPPGSSAISISRWAIEAWAEKKEGLPTSFTACTSVFVKAFVAGWSYIVDLFRLEDEDKADWVVLQMVADYNVTRLKLMIGPNDGKVEVAAGKVLPMYFPKTWVRACFSLDLDDGLVRIAANGQMLENTVYPNIKKLRTKRPSQFTIRVGKGQQGGQHSKWTDINMFSKPLESEAMLAITTSGNEACGKLGDFLKWTDIVWSLSEIWARGYDWKLAINASKFVDLAQEDGPCWRKAGIQVYPFRKDHHHSDCMSHCGKIGGGRVPSVVRFSQWQALQQEIESLTPRPRSLQWLWLAATVGYDGPHLDMVQYNYILVLHLLGSSSKTTFKITLCVGKPNSCP